VGLLANSVEAIIGGEIAILIKVLLYILFIYVSIYIT